MPLFLLAITPPDTPTWMHPYIEDRERYERHINPSFNSPADRNRADLYSRLRVGSTFDIRPNLTAKIEYQNSHDLFWTQALNGSTDNSDLSLAYVKYANSTETLIAGRQKIELGEQRLIGSTEWLTLARSFDAGRAQVGQWDVWGGKLGVANNKPEAAQIGAITHTDKNWGTTSVIAKHDLGAKANIDIQTLDHFVTHDFAGTAVSAEGALQTGSNNGRDQRAWAWHVKASRPILPKTTLSVQGDAASGGGNADTSRTFDNLYPSNHNLYGLADTTGWKNMNHLGVMLDNRVSTNWTVRASAHAYSLRDTSDAWYAATGGANPRSGGSFIDKTGLSGRDLGNEIDLEAILASKRSGTLSAGIAFFDPGHFVQAVGGHSNQMTYGFLQYQFRF